MLNLSKQTKICQVNTSTETRLKRCGKITLRNTISPYSSCCWRQVFERGRPHLFRHTILLNQFESRYHPLLRRWRI